jgi:hypothetical protein
MKALNSLWDSGPGGQRIILGVSLGLVLCGCLMAAFAAWTFALGGPTAAGGPDATLPAGRTPIPATPATLAPTLPAITPTLAITPTSGTPGATPEGQVCDCSGDLYGCNRTFPNDQPAAQACFDYCVAQGAGDVHQIDPDGNGVACDHNE